jgi:micrococcal nuclease
MNKKILVVFALAILVAGSLLVLMEFAPSSKETFEVSQIIDGDTIRLSTGEKVRLIGINTPERDQPYYAEATQKLSELIGDNQVTLEKDVTDKDQYGRLLRYIYVNETFVNLEMVKHGYAISYSFPPNTKHLSEFEAAEEEARNAGIGIWTQSSFTLTVSQLHADAEGDDSVNLNDEYVLFENNGNSTIIMTSWTVQDEAHNFYVFPEFGFANGSTLTLYTGSGTDTTTQLYWGNDKPIWNNDGDSLYLRDAEGLLVTYYSY